MEGGKGQGLPRERSEIHTPPSGRPASSTSRLFLPLRAMHSGVHSLSEHLLCAASTSVTSTQLTGKGLWAQAVLFRQQSWSGPVSPGYWSGAQRGISSSKGGRCREAGSRSSAHGSCPLFPLPSCWSPHNPWGKTGVPSLPDPLSSPKYPQFLSLSPSCPDFSLSHSSLQPFCSPNHEAAFSPLLSVHPAPACGRGGTQRAGWLEQGRNSSTHSAGRASHVGRAGL